MSVSQIALPACDPNERWLRPSQFKLIVARSITTVKNWCSDGTLIEFGYSVYQDPMGQWFIKTPCSLIREWQASASSAITASLATL